MSFGSEQGEASAQLQRQANEKTKMLSDIAYPAIRRVLGSAFGDINIDQAGQIGLPESVKKQFGTAREGINRDFDLAERGSEAYMTQSFKQSGNPYSQGQLQSAMLQQGAMMEQGRDRAMGQLQFQEAQAGLGQYNNLMNIMQGGTQTALNMGQGFGQMSNQALQFLPQQSQWGGAMSGAMAGAGAGSAFGPYGMIGGALLGGFGGYMSAG